jgi:hypothetical protein
VNTLEGMRTTTVQKDDISEQLVAALAELWAAGSLFVGRSEAEHREVADIALRRWNSFHRRQKRRSSTHERRVEDLAKGLRDAFEDDPRLVGPLMEDYRHIAAVLADILRGSER